MFTFEGVNYKSKSEAALSMLKAGKGRTEISKILGITYQTVHAVMKKAGLKSAPRVKKNPTKPDNTTKVGKVRNTTNNNQVVKQVSVDNAVTSNSTAV